jgi:conjugal transfer pilus assembly protein TraV
MFLLVILGLSLNGCSFSLSKLVNPYKDDFECPQAEKGKCVPIREAYLESLRKGLRDILFTPTTQTQFPPQQPTPQASPQKENEASFNLQSVFPYDNWEMYSKYNEALLRKLQEMLENPKTPILIPPQVVRVLILPYAAERDTFYAERYVYIIVEGPQWVFHNILNREELR